MLNTGAVSDTAPGSFLRRDFLMYQRKRIVVALGGNALGNTLPEQMIAVKSTAQALCDLIEEGHQVVVVHGWPHCPVKIKISRTLLSLSVWP